MLGVYYQLTEKVLCIDGFGIFLWLSLEVKLVVFEN